MSKQDKVAARTARDIEYKYNIGKSFAEATGAANDARKAAEEVRQQYEDMWAHDIHMEGSFISTGEWYLPPTYEDAVYTLRAVFDPDTYPLPEGVSFDLDGDGVFDENDAILALRVFKGEIPMKDCPGAVKTPVSIRIDMSNPEKAIRLYGRNMWGTEIDVYIGADVYNGSFAAKAYLDSIVQMDDDKITLYRVVDGEKEYFNPPMKVGVEYRTTERMLGKPVYTMVRSPSDTGDGQTIRNSETITEDGIDLVQVWYIK